MRDLPASTWYAGRVLRRVLEVLHRFALKANTMDTPTLSVALMPCLSGRVHQIHIRQHNGLLHTSKLQPVGLKLSNVPTFLLFHPYRQEVSTKTDKINRCLSKLSSSGFCPALNPIGKQRPHSSLIGSKLTPGIAIVALKTAQAPSIWPLTLTLTLLTHPGHLHLLFSVQTADLQRKKRSL